MLSFSSTCPSPFLCSAYIHACICMCTYIHTQSTAESRGTAVCNCLILSLFRSFQSQTHTKSQPRWRENRHSGAMVTQYYSDAVLPPHTQSQLCGRNCALKDLEGSGTNLQSVLSMEAALTECQRLATKALLFRGLTVPTEVLPVKMKNLSFRVLSQ